MKTLKLNEILNEQADNDYIVDVNVDIFTFDKNKLIEDTTVNVPFSLSIESRSWGIKSIIPVLSDIITIPYIEEDVTTGETEDKQIQLDLSALPVDYVNGPLTVQSINIYLDEKGNVDYGKSNLEFGNLS